MINLKQFGAKPAAPVRYWYHPESSSFFTESDEAKAMADGLAVEITREEYMAKKTKAESNAEPTLPPPAKPAGIKLGGLKLGVQTTPASAGQVVPPKVPSLVSKVPAAPAQVESVTAIDSKLTGPEGFQAKLDGLDRLIMEGQGLSQLTLDTARGYVGAIMTELKTNPEFDPLLKDRDVHNIMTFVQSSTQRATTVLTKAKEKREIKQAKGVNTTFDFSDIGDLGAVAKTPAQKAIAAATSVDAFAGLDLDSIPTIKNRPVKK